MPDIQSLMQQCPADIWRSRQSPRQRAFGPRKSWRSDECRDSVAKCAKACTDGLNGSACFAAARVLETDGAAEFRLASRQGFALACALGLAGGCTNSAAYIRTSSLSSDHLSSRRRPDTLSCLRRSFATACEAGHAWGCAMEGQSLRIGEGGPVDLQRARAQLGRACAISARQNGESAVAASCRFAKQQLQMLRAAEE